VPEERKATDGPAPRGPFDHPDLTELREQRVDHAPGWNESAPEEGEKADGAAEAVPPRNAGDVPRAPLAERARRSAAGGEER
jgi:hypothetical protein